jgi:LPS-assembly protein
MVGSESRKGYYEDSVSFCAKEENLNSAQCEFYNISSVEDETQLDFIQYIYDSEAKQVLYHRLAQKISFSNVKSEFGELENELDYMVTDYFSIYNNMFYNYDKNLFSKIFNKLSIHKYGVELGLSHLYKDSFIDATATTPRYTSYLTSTLRYTYNSHYSYSALYNYDSISQETKSMEVGFMYKKRCWDFGIRYSENNRPILTKSGESSVYDKYVYFTIVLKPLMQADGTPLVTYQLPNSN